MSYKRYTSSKSGKLFKRRSKTYKSSSLFHLIVGFLMLSVGSGTVFVLYEGPNHVDILLLFSIAFCFGIPSKL